MTKETAGKWEAGKTNLQQHLAQLCSQEESRERLEVWHPQRGGAGRGQLLHNNGAFIRGGCAQRSREPALKGPLVSWKRPRGRISGFPGEMCDL